MPARPHLLLALSLTSLLLGACEPIRTPSLFGQPPTVPTQDPPDAGPPTPEAGSIQCWQTRELTQDVDTLAFTFDSQGVGHFAFNRGPQVYLGSTRPDDTAVPVAALALGVPRTDVADIAIDSQGQRHLLLYWGYAEEYYTHVSYAYEQHGTWSHLTWAFSAGRYPLRLKLDAQGFVHMLVAPGVYPQDRLSYVTNRVGGWTITELDIHPRDRLVDLAVDAQGKAHIAYLDSTTSKGIYYATNASGAWGTELVANILGSKPVLALDAQGRPHLAYSSSGQAHHATKRGGIWVFNPLGYAFGNVSDLKVDAAGNLHALVDTSPSPNIAYTTLLVGGELWSQAAPLVPEWEGGHAQLITNVLGLDAFGEVRVGYQLTLYDKTGRWTGYSVQYAQPCPHDELTPRR